MGVAVGGKRGTKGVCGGGGEEEGGCAWGGRVCV